MNFYLSYLSPHKIYFETDNQIENFVNDWNLTTNMLELGDRLKILSCTRLRILLNTICRKPGFNSLRTPLNHGAEQASNETLKQTQQRN